MKRTADEEREVVKAEEILAKIERGEPVEYENVIVEGDLDLSKAVLPKNDSGKFLVASPIEIKNSEVRGKVNFNRAVFKRSIQFYDTNFSKDVSFSYARFNKSVIFIRSQFFGASIFDGSQFTQDVLFNGVHFNKSTSFGGTHFEKDIHFLGTHFIGYAYFWQGVKFYGDVVFLEVQFVKDVFFENTQFYKNVQFLRTQFKRYATFENAQFYTKVQFCINQFRGYASFENTRFGLNVLENTHISSRRSARFENRGDYGDNSDNLSINFYNSSFDDIANFEHAKFYLESDFSDVRFGKEATKFRDARFKRSASFKAATFAGFTNFMEAWFREDADFAEAKFLGDSRFDEAHFDKNLILTRTRISTMALINCQLKNKSEIIMKDAVFNRLYVKWEFLKTHLKYEYEDGYDWTTYSALIKNFRDLVRFDDADDCYFEFRKKHQDTKNWFRENTNRICRFNWSKLYDWIGLLSCGYGTKLSRSFIWVVIFAAITLSLYNKYGSDNIGTMCFGLFLSGIVLPLFIVVLARKLIR